MADPTARFVLSGVDMTAAAFRSADRNLRQFQRGLMNTRQLLGAFGVAFGLRAVGTWISDTIRSTQATKEQSEAFKAAHASLTKLNQEIQNSSLPLLARFAELIGQSAEGWRQFLYPTESEETVARIAELNTLITTTQSRIERLGRGDVTDFGRAKEIEAAGRALFQYRQEMDKLWEDRKRQGGHHPAVPVDELKEMLPGNGRSLDLPISLSMKPSPDFSALFDGLQEISAGNGESLELPVSLQLMQVDANEVRKLFEPIKKESKFTAEFLGDNFKDAFEGWILGTERSFKDMLRRMAVQMATSALFSGLAQMFPGGSFFANFFGGSRASGGSTRGGMVYKVHPGEAFFTPGQDGHVGAAAGGGGVTINQYNTYHGGDRDEIAAAQAMNNARLQREIEAKLRQDRSRRRF